MKLPIFLLLWLALVGFSQSKEVEMKLNGVRIHANFEKSANWPQGPVVLITHGTLAHNHMELIRALQTLFSEQGVSSLALNLSLGINNRPSAPYDCQHPHRHKHTDALDEIGAWLEWLKVAGAKQVALLGHSRGGNQTAWFAAERDDPLISHLILIAPQTWSAEQAAKAYKERFGKALAPVLETAFSLAANGKGKQLIQPVDILYCPQTSASAESFISYYERDPRLDTPYLLSKIHKPVLVFVGSEDKVVKGLLPRLQGADLPDSVEVVEMEGADHFFRDLYAEELVEQAVEFLNTPASAP